MKRLFLLLLPLPAFADYTITEDAVPFSCDANPDGFFLATETFPTEQAANDRASVMVDEYQTEVDVICASPDRDWETVQRPL